MTGICKEEELPAESEVEKMALKHRITINVTDPHGNTGTVLKGADAILDRLVRNAYRFDLKGPSRRPSVEHQPPADDGIAVE